MAPLPMEPFCFLGFSMDDRMDLLNLRNPYIAVFWAPSMTWTAGRRPRARASTGRRPGSRAWPGHHPARWSWCRNQAGRWPCPWPLPAMPMILLPHDVMMTLWFMYPSFAPLILYLICHFIRSDKHLCTIAKKKKDECYNTYMQATVVYELHYLNATKTLQ